MAEFVIENTQILSRSSSKAVQNLLCLYSVKSLRERWQDFKGSKAEIGLSAIAVGDYESILNFVFDKFSTCKQHNYIYRHSYKFRDFPPITVNSATRVGSQTTENSVIIFYIAKVDYQVILWKSGGDGDSIKRDTIQLLMPFCIEVLDNYLLLRFITFEKKLDSYFDGINHVITSRSLDEDSFLELLELGARQANINLQKADLHKGIKALMETDLIGGKIAKIEKGNRTTTEAMNGDLEIKLNAPEVYEDFKNNSIHNSSFIWKSPDEGFTARKFSANLTEGTIDFSSYSERKEDTDYVIKEILRCN